MESRPVRLLLAGTEDEMCQRVRTALEALPGATLVGQAETGDEVIVNAAQLTLDIVLIDTEITGVHALLVTQRLKTAYPSVTVVAWIHLDGTGTLPDEKALWMRHFGACCVIDDRATHNELVQGLIAAAGSAHFLSSRLDKRAALSTRQHEVLGMLAAGWSIAKIARTLKLSPSTINSHLDRIGRRLRAVDHSETAAQGRELGFDRDVLDVQRDPGTSYRQREKFYRALDEARKNQDSLDRTVLDG
jgi:DNA-binding NarL/FixJ family response regulator